MIDPGTQRTTPWSVLARLEFALSPNRTRPSSVRAVVLAVASVTVVSLAGAGAAAGAEPTQPDAAAPVVPAPEAPAELAEAPTQLAEAPAEDAPSDDGTETVAAVVVEDGKRTVVTVEAAPSEVADVEDELADRPGVVDVFVDAPARAADVVPPRDAWLDRQWAFPELQRQHIPWDGVPVGMPVLVAVLDTGVAIADGTPDLTRVLCWKGADFTVVPEDGSPIVSTGDGCVDPVGHGTHVAGIVGADWDNGSYVAGVSQAGIMPVRVLDEHGWGTVAGITAGIYHAVDNGARVINMSIVGDGVAGESGYEDAITYALDHDVVVVAAAGNNRLEGNRPQYPAAVPGVISVAATDEDHLSAPFSYQGPTNFISAPGVNILSTAPFPQNIASMSGTSMAAPHVAGIVAWYRDQHPAATVDEIRTAIRETAIDMERPGWDSSTGWGMIDMAELLTGTQWADPDTYLHTVPAAPVITAVSPRDSALRVDWRRPHWNGGASVRRYGVHVLRYRCLDGQCDYEYTTTVEAPNTATSLTVPGLVNGRTYVALAYARSDERDGQYSLDSPLVRVDAPRITGVTAAAEAARVTWTAPRSVDGSAVARYVVDVYSGSTRVKHVAVSASTRALRATGLVNGRKHTFVVWAEGTQGVRVPSTRSAAVTPKDVPGAPRIGTPVAADDAARVYWAAPSDTGGAAISGYVVKVYSGTRGIKSLTVSGAARSVLVTGLASRASYSFTVTAKNSVGSGPASARSVAVRTT